jgi:hypothetical protein
MEIIQRKIPCTFCGSKQHCVAVCWKQKVYNKKVMAMRSMPRRDDATLQIKKDPHVDSAQSRQVSVKSNRDSTQQKQDSIKFISAQNCCSYCQKNGHGKDICWKLHPELRRSREPKEPKQKEDVAEERKDDLDIPPARDGSPDWNWPDFMPYM